MMKSKVFLLLAFLILPNYGQATSTDRATSFVMDLAQQAIHSLTQSSLSESERRYRFAEFLRTSFDMPSIARFTFGRYWRQATPEQKERYVGLFTDAMARQYSSIFKKYSGQKILNRGKATNFGQKGIMVHTTIVQPSGKHVLIDWRVRDKSGRLRIIDVIVEGVSMAVTQREETTSLIQQNGNNIERFLNSF